MTTEQIIKELEQRQGVYLKIEGNVFYINNDSIGNPEPIIRSYLRDMGINNPGKVAKEIIQYLR
jgi:hypothetical protein